MENSSNVLNFPTSSVASQRVAADESAAVENGFAPVPLLYHGYAQGPAALASAKADQKAHDDKPLAKDLARSLVTLIENEVRQDLGPYTAKDMRMQADGRIMLSSGSSFHPNRTGFRRLMNRQVPASSAASYLEDCAPRLRAINFNNWMKHIEEDAPSKDSETVLRTRLGRDGAREIFTAVSERYTPFDADLVGNALHEALPHDARGDLDYNGNRYRLEALWQTDVCPSQFIEGEVFKAGVIIRSDDTGAGSIRVQSVIWRNLCKNLCILDKAVGVDLRLRHSGTPQKLTRQFITAFEKALSSVDGFRLAWGAAMQERDEQLIARSQGTTSDTITNLPVEAVLPGLFNGILKSDLVAVGGRRADLVPKLLEMHSQDEARDAYGISRASIVNAFTRYAHVVESSPFAADRIREDAGALLSGNRRNAEPTPLPYLAVA